MIYLLLVPVVLLLIFFWYIRQPQFGKAPSGARLQRLQQSPHFQKGKFQNLSHTPPFTEGYNMAGVMFQYFFKRNKNRKPLTGVPVVKTDLKKLPPETDVLVWFGHSSYYLQVSGKRFLIDPVFSKNASPLPGTNTAFRGTDAYTVEDLPFIDYLLISHDHYDHLDYHTILKLKEKCGQVITGLGVGSHLEHWGYNAERILENDWYDSIELSDGMQLHITPARHFSGRGFTRNNTLWVSFVLHTPAFRIFLGGDSGYDSHFAEIGKRFGPFDLALVDNGQYNSAWRYIHAHPEDNLRAAEDLQAKRLMPVHSGKFAMANHAWNEPLTLITSLNKSKKLLPIITPRIGEPVYLQEPQQFSSWYRSSRVWE